MEAQPDLTLAAAWGRNAELNGPLYAVNGGPKFNYTAFVPIDEALREGIYRYSKIHLFKLPRYRLA